MDGSKSVPRERALRMNVLKCNWRIIYVDRACKRSSLILPVYIPRPNKGFYRITNMRMSLRIFVVERIHNGASAQHINCNIGRSVFLALNQFLT